MKKRVLAAVCAVMLLSGCYVSDIEENFFDTSDERSYTVSSMSAVTSSDGQYHGESSVPNSTALSEQSHEVSSMPPSIEQTDQGSSTTSGKPDAELTFSIDKKILEAAYINMCLTLYNDGELSGDNPITFIEKTGMVHQTEVLLKDEVYESVNSNGEFPTKQDYVKTILMRFPDVMHLFDENGNLTSPIRPAMYIDFTREKYPKPSNPETEKQAFFLTAEWIISKLTDPADPAITDLVNSTIESFYPATSVDYSVNNDGMIEILAKINCYGDSFELNDKLYIGGKD